MLVNVPGTKYLLTMPIQKCVLNILLHSTNTSYTYGFTTVIADFFFAILYISDILRRPKKFQNNVPVFVTLIEGQIILPKSK